MTEEYDLSKSEKSLGKLYPILKDAHGNIIDGFHRQNTNPDWPTLKIDSVDTPQKLELARLAANFCRRQIPASEIQNRIVFLVKSGMTPTEISEKTGISIATIYRHIPQDLKSPTSEAISEGRKEQVARATSVVRQPTELTECERCHAHTSTPKLWHDHQLCEQCYDKAILNPEPYLGYFRYLEKKKNGQVPETIAKTRIIEKPEQREAVMHPMDSKGQIEFVNLLRTKAASIGLKVSTDPEECFFCTEGSRADWVFITAKGDRIPGYYDPKVTHGPKRKDRDETLRDKIKRRYNVNPISVPIETGSRQEHEKKAEEAVEGLKFEG